MAWFNWPNRITITRIILIAPLVICMLNLQTAWPYWRYLAMLIFVVMAISDGLDGYLARRLHEETPLGKYLDPVADKLLVTCAVILLAVEQTAVPGFRLPSWVPVIAIGKDLLTVIGFALVHAATGRFLVQPRILGKACTLVQLVMVAVVLAAPDLPRVCHPAVPVLYWLASVLAVAALVDYIRFGGRFASTNHPKQQG